MKRLLPDLRNSRAGIEPRRVPRTEDSKPLGYRFVNDAADPTTTELWLYDEIGMWGIAAADVIDQLMSVSTPNLRVRINSPGGDVFDGIAIMNALASFNGTVTGVVDSLCASIATAIAMACETLTMSPGSQMMIHPASGICFGDATDMQQMANVLSFQTANIAGLYANRAGGEPAGWLALMQAETWMTADEAVSCGLADATGVVKQSGTAVVPAAPSWDDMWDLSVFRFAGRAKAPAPKRQTGDDSAATVLGLINSTITAETAAVAKTLGGLQDKINYLAECKASRACNCGPGNWTMANRDGQHTADCPALGTLTPRPVNLPAPAGVQWELVPFDGCCDICQDIVDASPYPEDDLPDVPVHPNCDCELQVAYGVDNHHASSPITAEAEFDTELFRSTLREVFA